MFVLLCRVLPFLQLLRKLFKVTAKPQVTKLRFNTAEPAKTGFYPLVEAAKHSLAITHGLLIIPVLVLWTILRGKLM